MAFRLINKRPLLVLSGGKHSILSSGQLQDFHPQSLLYTFSKTNTLTNQSINFLSTKTDQLNKTNSTPSVRRKDPLDLTFNNSRDAYKSKRTSQLIRGYIVLTLSSFNFLVENHEKFIKLGRRVLGKRLFTWLVRNTFYAHFVAGENEVAIKPTLDHLRSFGVKSILDYSAEEDISSLGSDSNDVHETIDTTESQINLPSTGVDEDQLKQFKLQDFDDRRNLKIIARTYFYLNEAQCEKNMEIFLKCIDAVAGATAHTGLAAIKLTALGRPQLLLQLSEVIARTRMFFTEVTGEDRMALGQISPQDFQKRLDQRFQIKTDNPEIRKWLDTMDYDRRGLMNIFSWNGLVDMQRMMSDVFTVLNIRTGRIEKVISALTNEEEEMFRNMMRRVHTIARHADERDVRVMIDAEQSYFQPAINRITMELMRKYNKERAIIFNTYQCYLKNAFETLSIDLELARRQNIFFGAKLVRGAYMNQERLRAKQVGYEDPINPTYEHTSEMYQKCLEECMQQIIATGKENKKTGIMVASHNEDTVRFTVEKMKELNIEPEDKVICFGQLYGMCDHISFPLGQSGYSVYKYVPYGPIDEVIPYLSRRAAENHGILGKVQKEKRLLLKEVGRRLSTGQLFYRPKGDYTPV